MTNRDLNILRDVAAGRVHMTCSCEPALTIDGLCCCDQTAGHRLTTAGLITPTTPGVPGQAVLATLTDTARTLLVSTT